MASEFLDGGMIPRSVTRMFDQREERRDPPPSDEALLVHGGARHDVRLLNLSRSGAMVIFSSMTHIGDPVELGLPGRSPAAGKVCWVRDGRIGVTFDGPLEF